MMSANEESDHGFIKVVVYIKRTACLYFCITSLSLVLKKACNIFMTSVFSLME